MFGLSMYTLGDIGLATKNVATGTVSSVALSLPAILFAVTGSPITGTGTITATLQPVAANVVLAGPTTGVHAEPTLRALVAADIPGLDASKITAGTIATARLGSGAANSTVFLRGDGTWAAPPSGTGTVTSIGISAPSEITVASSPITTSGTIALSWTSQAANVVFASPNGSTGTPVFRALASADIPNLDAAKITTGTISSARLGSGTANSSTYLRGDGSWTTPPTSSGTVTSVGISAPSEITVASSPITTSGTIALSWTSQTANLVFASPNGSSGAPSMRALVAADIPSLDASKITTGTISSARLGSGTANSSTFLRGDGTWSVPGGGGTVTSIGISAPSEITVASSPVTTSGTIALSWTSQAANLVFASPNGSSGAPMFRALVAADIPNLDAAKITTGTITTARLGSGTANSTTFLRGDSTWQTITATPAGSNTQIQYNASGSLGATSSFTFDATNGILTAASVSANTNSVAVFTDLTTATAAAQEAVTVRLNSSGTPSAGFASDIGLYLHTSTTTNTQAAALRTIWSTATHASRTSVVAIMTVDNAGTMTERIRFGTSTAGYSAVMTPTDRGGITVNQTYSGAVATGSNFASTMTVTSVTGSGVGIVSTVTLNTGAQSNGYHAAIQGMIAAGTVNYATAYRAGAGVFKSSQQGIAGLMAQSGVSNLLAGTPQSALIVMADADSTNLSSTVPLMEIYRTSSAPSAGYGVQILFSMRSTSALSFASGRIDHDWSDPTDASSASRFRFYVRNAGAMTEGFSIVGTGGIRVGTSSIYFGLKAAASGTTVWTMPTGDGTNGQVLKTDGSGNLGWVSAATGTVTSIGVSAPSEITVASSPVTTSGTIALSWTSQTANLVFASPNGSSGTPAFRALVAADIPSLDAAKIASGTIATARLGSGTANSTTFLRGDGSWQTVSAAPAGSNTNVQYNSSGTLAGSPFFTWTDGSQLKIISTGTDPLLSILLQASSGGGSGIEIKDLSAGTNTTPFINIDGSANTARTISAFLRGSAYGQNQINQVMRYSVYYNGTPSADFGAAQEYFLKTTTTQDQKAGSMRIAWSTVTHASRSSYWAWTTVLAAGAETERLRIYAHGQQLVSIENQSPSSAQTAIQFVGDYAAGSPSTNYGLQLAFAMKSATVASRYAGEIGITWSTATDATRTSQCTISLANSATTVAAMNLSGTSVLDLTQSTGAIRINGTQVLGPRILGWTAWTGTKSRASINTSSGTLANALQAIGQLVDDLQTHGII